LLLEFLGWNEESALLKQNPREPSHPAKYEIEPRFVLVLLTRQTLADRASRPFTLLIVPDLVTHFRLASYLLTLLYAQIELELSNLKYM